MTYRQLLEQLQKLPPEQLDLDVSIGDPNIIEFWPATGLVTTWREEDEPADGILDDGHPYISVRT